MLELFSLGINKPDCLLTVGSDEKFWKVKTGISYNFKIELS